MLQDGWVTVDDRSIRTAAWDGADTDGPAVVVLHGLGTSVDVLRGARPGVDPYARLAAEGLHVLGLDWPGHGRSGGRRGQLDYRGAMAAVGAAVTVAQRRWGAPVGVLGTGLGGALALYATIEDERLGAAVCHNLLDLRDIRPAAHRRRHEVLLPVAALLARALPPATLARLRVPLWALVPPGDLAADPHVSAALRRHPEAVRRWNLAGLCAVLLTPEDKPDVAAAHSPVLIAWGTEDRVLSETAARHVLSRLSCPTQRWTLPGGSHQLLVEHPEAFVPAAAGFLRDHLAGRAAR